MDPKERVLNAIYKACDAINSGLPDTEHLGKTLQTPLTGPNVSIDSLNMINLILEIEAAIEQDFGKKITLINDETFSLEHGHMQNIGTLASFILTILNRT